MADKTGTHFTFKVFFTAVVMAMAIFWVLFLAEVSSTNGFLNIRSLWLTFSCMMIPSAVILMIFVMVHQCYSPKSSSFIMSKMHVYIGMHLATTLILTIAFGIFTSNSGYKHLASDIRDDVRSMKDFGRQVNAYSDMFVMFKSLMTLGLFTTTFPVLYGGYLVYIDNFKTTLHHKKV